ncbi:MAG TPA: magnesium/cobalt transporter CorA [Casimicrobiaceae bacterium]|nr:magnesium/cobalt transporter CorA [Casimicrobiaceae bacterium]
MLVNCVAYQEGRKLADIPKEDISEYVKRPDCFVWVALKDPDAAELEEMREEFGLHELAVEDARNGHQRPKIEEYGDSLFAVLHTVEMRDEDLSVGEVDIFVGPNYVLSTRVGTERGFADVRARCEHEPELLKHGAAYVFYALMDKVVDRYFPVLDTLETELESIEEKIFVKNVARANIEALYALKRKLMTLKHAVDPLLEAVGKLYGGRVPQICAGMGEYFRDVFDHLQRLHGTIEGIRDMQTTAIQVNLGMINLNETEVTKKLAGWAAIIAVPTLIAGVWGMNFKHMPELELDYGYPLAIAAMIGIDIALYVWFRKIRWL